jgi:bacillithiol biosynthesis cysteine-adding enzyme BshC
MECKKIPLANTKSFSPFFLDYVSEAEPLKPYYNRFPLIENFQDQINDKSVTFTDHNRAVLVDVLQQQYKGMQLSVAVSNNINSLLDKKTFTITTGHQLAIFTGPLYFIYKIVTVINACKKLKQAYPENNFVPIYWMASEDHDYDEIKYFNLFGEKHTWETDQKGAVGRFNPHGLATLASQLSGNTSIFFEAYAKNNTLADATRHYVNALFGHEGLLVLDADNRALKTLFKQVIYDDLFNHTPKKAVDKTTSKLHALGYHTQVNAREINHFYLDKNLRSRIEKTTSGFSVVDTDITFTEEEVKRVIEETPEKFSPNVILRPLYQETILPNLAYAGGPAELVYWLQLKEVFNLFNTPFPFLMPRNFALVMDYPSVRKFNKTGLELVDLFEEKNFLFNHWIIKNTHHNLSLGKEMGSIQEVFRTIADRSMKIDSTLAPMISAQSKKALNSLEKIEHKLLKAEKRLHADKLGQLDALKNSLFPKGGLQERTDNFLTFYHQDNQFINKLLTYFDAFDFRFNVLMYDQTGA